MVSINYLYNLLQETLKELFPSWEAVKRYREVIIFVAGLMKDSRPLVQFLYEMQVEVYLNVMRAGGYPSIDVDLFKWFQAECTVPLPHPLHNKYINYYYYHHPQYGDPDTAPVYYPSRLYCFDQMRLGVVLENHLIQGEEIPPCAMSIGRPDEAVRDSLLSICSQVSRYQAVTDLWMFKVYCSDATEAEAPILSRNIRSLFINSCKLSTSFMRNMLQQLHNCVTLMNLELLAVDLREVEKDLDKLLDNLVSNHEKGLSQEKLTIWIDDNSLSEQFVTKWNERCEGITSIHFYISNDDSEDDDDYSDTDNSLDQFG